MIRVSILNAALLSTALWMSSLTASARTNAFVSTANRAQVPVLWAGAIYTGADDGGKGNGNKDGGDEDKDKDDHHHHAPTPEPSTIFSFGAAILIGGGVLYSRRLRKIRK